MEREEHTPTRNSEWRRFTRVHPNIRKMLSTVAISFITSLIVVGVVAGIVWAHRGKIVTLLLSTVPVQQTRTPGMLEPTEPATEPITTNQTSKELSVTEVVAKANPSVVSIEVSQQTSLFPKVVGRGTGFFVTANGYIVTNRHVVDTANATYEITTTSGKKYVATLVAKDPVYDLAVLKVQGNSFPAAVLGDSNELALGQSVVAIGFALGKFENSISVGVISGLSRSIVAGGGGSSEQLDRVIQTDAAINPGNSGGPLINLKGEVIGVNVAVAQGSQSVGFAIPSDSVKQVVDSVKAYGYIVRPYVGVSYVQITEALQVKNDLPVDHGIFVNEVIPDSPALRAGIKVEDIILSVDGITLDGDPSFSTIIRNKKVGQTISVMILRDGVKHTLKLTLAQAPDS